MMKMGQTELGRRLGLTAMAVSKYERGEIRIGASRLQEISTILQVTPAFFFEPTSTRVQRKTKEEKRRWPDHVTDLMATPDGLALAKAFAEIKDLGSRRRIIRLVVDILATSKRTAWPSNPNTLLLRKEAAGGWLVTCGKKAARRKKSGKHR
jgi:transcriptional regulator with XRE-family HTH domain